MLFADIQRTSLMDYPGKIVSTLFTQGCNFRCHYCHNADLVETTDGKLTEEEVLKLLDERKKYIDGICITGGEPLMHDLINFLQKVKEKGFLVKIDTNGTNPLMLHNLIDKNLIDYIAMDIKAPFEKYNLVTDKTVDIDKIKASIRIIKESNLDHEFRTTVVRDLLTKEDIKKIGQQLFEIDGKKSKKLFLQQFGSQEKLVDPEFIGKLPFDPDDFMEMIASVADYFDTVEARGI